MWWVVIILSGLMLLAGDAANHRLQVDNRSLRWQHRSFWTRRWVDDLPRQSRLARRAIVAGVMAVASFLRWLVFCL
ncbi:MAG: hypothetical protein N3B01_10615 [Verrucomicrobiae bacterium]|nr:hypothetical protein [Verrucomicrobiae bacterium]